MALWLTTRIFWIACCAIVSHALPITDENDLVLYLKKIGYLGETSNLETFAIRAKEAISTSLMDSPKSTSLSETGELDNETIAMMNMPKLYNVKDNSESSTRKKRYIEGGNSSEVPTKKPLDCADVLEMGHNKSGVYKIWPVNRVTGGKHLYVYCDMETNGGGWTVIQRRGDFQKPIGYLLQMHFVRKWRTYREGFGEIEKDFWLGNDNIFALTNQKLYSVRIDLKDFEGNSRYALYDNFWIADEDNKYRLQIWNYSGDAGDSMYDHNNQSFSTADEDNAISPINNSTDLYDGGWWYTQWNAANLNGVYYNEQYVGSDGIYWFAWKSYESLAWTEMKIRPKNFRLSFS